MGSASANALELYHASFSYFSTVARLALAEAGLSYQSHLIDLVKNEQMALDYLKMNPNGTVPTLIFRPPDAEERVFVESRDILDWCAGLKPMLNSGKDVEAFVERWYKGDLAYDEATGPAAPEAKRSDLVKKWEGRAQELESALEKAKAEGDLHLIGVLEAKRDSNFEKARKFPSRGPPWGPDRADAMVSEIEKFLLADGKDPAKDWICGPEFSKADICAVVLLDRLASYGYEGVVWGNGKHEPVVQYLRRVRARPSYHEGFTKWAKKDH
ncbi:hypothetical protein DFJ74DRAFT_684091 [Hyaloraphidium curvatum]|nr:hypothetical protein DFJ74DRAFT_684091 [Hyaloraphidium curvatum]